MISWIKIFQMHLIDEVILKKRKRFQESFSSDLDEGKEFLKELNDLIDRIKKEYLELKFDKTPSVEVDRIRYENNQKIVQRAKLLSKINLYQHIINVERFIEEDLNLKNINDYVIIRLLAVLHDAGKSKLLRNKYKIPHDIPHEKASYIYAAKILKDTSFEYVPEYLIKDTYYLTFLHNADKIAREKELLQLKTLEDKDF
ncbi:hypothetical protein [Caminibacter sp.]